MESAAAFTSPWGNRSTLRGHISNKEGPLTKALDNAKAVCEQCGALDKWEEFESYILHCLYNNVPAVPGFSIPPPRQKGRMGVPADQEVLRREIKNLTREIETIQEAILEKMQENPAANHAMAVSILVRWFQVQISDAFALLTSSGQTRVTKPGATASRICVQHILHGTVL